MRFSIKTHWYVLLTLLNGFNAAVAHGVWHTWWATAFFALLAADSLQLFLDALIKDLEAAA